jgi:hypothetical protein
MRCTPVNDRHSDRVGRNRPAVVVFYHPDPGNRDCLREINAGMEEEGVPCRTEGVPDRVEGVPDREDAACRAEDAADGSARELAFAAAQVSNLDVGVGVDAMGYICVHHAKLPPDAPAVAGPASSARTMGHHAARLVVGIPFKQEEGSSHA